MRNISKNYTQLLLLAFLKKICEVERNMRMVQKSGVFDLAKIHRSEIIDAFIHEEECLKILQLLLDNGADPLIEINMEREDNGPKSYNALKFAAEIGWLRGVKIMCEHVKKTHQVKLQMIDEWLEIAVGWEDQWSSLWKDIPYSELYAKQCREVVNYLRTLSPAN
jgi:hypothetical protein